jgi:carboxypeptidase family protein
MASGALFLALGLALLPQVPGAGTVIVHGRVTDATSLPLPGATIAVKGSDAFAVTSDRGEFDLAAPAGARLIVSLPGYLGAGFRDRPRSVYIGCSLIK